MTLGKSEDTKPVFASNLCEAARRFAEKKHRGHVRKYSKKPYVVHLEAVVETLRAAGIDAPIVLAAAYLHDTVEDTDTTFDEIHGHFGEEVCQLVYWLTDAEKGKRRLRKVMSAWRLGRAPWNAKLIKLADFIDNSADISRNDPGFAPVYLAEKRKILAEMAANEGQRLSDHPLFVAASRDG